MPNRRDLMKVSLFAGGAAMLSAKSALAQIPCNEFDRQTSPVLPASPATTPFLSPLIIPKVAVPVNPNSLQPPPNPAMHQQYNRFFPLLYYKITEMEAQVQVHPQLPPTTIWGFNGTHPGPTIIAAYGVPILVRFQNALPANHVGFGLPSTSTHLHNMHTPSESDGFPADFYDPGTYRDNHYPLYPAGGTSKEVLNTLWYHDHRQDFTAPNVYKGLAGFFLAYDSLDIGIPGLGLNLPAPYGVYDIPLMFVDMRFDQYGQQIFDTFDFDGVLGDKRLVNGQIQPYLNVEPRKYRFRLLNIGPSRFYQYSLSNGQPMIQISNDGNLLPAPITVNSVTLGVAERTDVIIDFSTSRPGDVLYLQNIMEQLNGRGPTTRRLAVPEQLLQFRVGSLKHRDASTVPSALRPLPPIDVTQAVQHRMWKFDYFQGSWIVNGQVFDANRVDAQVKQGTSEIWTIRNEGTLWSHPIHIHFEEFRLLERNGVPIDSNSIEHSRKDVIRIMPGDEVKVFFTFRDFLGRYPMHCHNVVHEDHSMMIRWDIVP